MPDIHSKLSPSSAHRWLACPASLEGTATDDRSSEYAAEGTVAHELASACYLLDQPPERLLGETRTRDGHEITITQEMVDSVQLYLDTIENLAGESRVAIESRIEHSEILGFGGTLDCALLKRPHIIDFKYGAGVTVDVVDNSQLACYALLYLDKYRDGKLEDVAVTIVQPRASHVDGPVRTWNIEADYLTDFKSRIETVSDGERLGEIHAGDHCRWCPRSVDCPELYELTLKQAEEDFNQDSMTPERAAEVLSMQSAVNAYFDSVSKWVHGQLDKGTEVPGYKLVDRFGNRRFSVDEETVVRKCRNKGFGKKQIFKTQLLTPAQLEKVVGKELVLTLVERPHIGTAVASESDRRPAVNISRVEDEFAEAETIE